MQFSSFATIPAPETPLAQRLGVFAVCLAFGAWMIYVGRFNVQTREAEETGKRALFLSLQGKSTSMKGRYAVFTGWMRIVVGVLAIAFGFVFLIFGAFLKQ